MTNLKLLKFFIFFLILNLIILFHAEAAFFENKSNLLFLEKIFFDKQKYLIFLIFFITSLILFKKKQFILFSIFFLIQLFTIIYWDSLILWLRDLAGDSLSEVNTLNIYFIYSWLLSIFNYFEPDIRISNFLKFYSIGLITYFSFFIFFKKQKIYSLYFPLILTSVFLYLFINFNISHLLVNVTTQKDIKQYFKNSKITHKAKNGINVILYIGESNSSLHTQNYINNLMSNAKILDKGKFVYFDDIYATHTHSTPSLLRLLSVAKNDNENLIKPIVKRNSLNIFSFLDSSIKKSYISSTGITGFNNIHYPIFFEDFDRKFFLDNSNYNFEKEFFLDSFQNVIGDKNKDNLIIFHSTVGHAPYLKYIPKKTNDLNENNNKEFHIKLLGNNKKNYVDYSNYKKALKYNFNILESIISEINENTPTILIYLSDHGESVYTGMGHDSSRLVHEMLRIPFLIYYNNEFIKEYSNKIKFNDKYKNKITTTDIFKKIFFDVYSLNELKNIYFDTKNDKYEKIIFQRNKKDIIEYIDLNYNRIRLPKNYIIKEEKDTNIHVLAKNIDEKKICYHASNTIARIKRALMLTSCLEFDLVVEEDNFYIYHPPNKNINFTLDEFFELSDNAKTYWIDAKNINKIDNCNKLYLKIYKNKDRKVKFFIEFPSDSILENENLLKCIKNFKKINAEVSYYISNFDLDKCIENLNDKNIFCDKLLKKILFLDKQNIFDNISFDYKFVKIMTYFDLELKNLRLNTWHIGYEEVKKLDFNKYNLIIPYNTKYNKNIL